VLIDTTPELRLQCLACNIEHVDAVLYTHHHADHVAGLDDLRRFNVSGQGPLPVYAAQDTLDRLAVMFDYAFRHDPDYPSAKPLLEPRLIDGPWELYGRRVEPIPLLHGELPVLGFRFGGLAYCTDCSRIPDASWKLLADLDVLILDGLRKRPHPTHFNLEQAVEAASRIGAKQTYFTHIAHELGHAETNANLPANMALAYDGQTLEL
jgi:phosphoribosyl 1,2-cyclic phosphate phosphodiesterase